MCRAAHGLLLLVWAEKKASAAKPGKPNWRVVSSLRCSLEANGGHVTNVEVLRKLTKVKEDRGQRGKQPAIEKEVLRHLSQTPAGLQVYDDIKNVLDELKQVPLSTAEKIMLINLRPTTEAQLCLLVEDCEKRFSDEQRADLVNYLVEALPSVPEPKDDAAAEDGTAGAGADIGDEAAGDDEDEDLEDGVAGVPEDDGLLQPGEEKEAAAAAAAFAESDSDDAMDQ